MSYYLLEQFRTKEFFQSLPVIRQAEGEQEGRSPTDFMFTAIGTERVWGLWPRAARLPGADISLVPLLLFSESPGDLTVPQAWKKPSSLTQQMDQSPRLQPKDWLKFTEPLF